MSFEPGSDYLRALLRRVIPSASRGAAGGTEHASRLGVREEQPGA